MFQNLNPLVDLLWLFRCYFMAKWYIILFFILFFAMLRPEVMSHWVRKRAAKQDFNIMFEKQDNMMTDVYPVFDILYEQ